MSPKFEIDPGLVGKHSHRVKQKVEKLGGDLEITFRGSYIQKATVSLPDHVKPEVSEKFKQICKQYGKDVQAEAFESQILVPDLEFY